MPNEPHGCRVLIVDDNVDAADTAAELLRFYGCIVDVAYSGADALAAMRQTAPRIAFFDLGMPVMNGYQLAQQTRASFGDAIHLVALSGWGAAADRAKARDAGFDEHLVKPADPTAMLGIVDRIRGATR